MSSKQVVPKLDGIEQGSAMGSARGSAKQLVEQFEEGERRNSREKEAGSMRRISHEDSSSSPMMRSSRELRHEDSPIARRSSCEKSVEGEKGLADKYIGTLSPPRTPQNEKELADKYIGTISTPRTPQTLLGEQKGSFKGEQEEKVLAPSTLVAQMRGGEEKQYNSITPAIYPATTYLREPDGSYPLGTIYARDNNPTAKPAEQALQELEDGADALLFSSGMSAAMAVFQSLSPGDKVIIPHIMYWGLRNWVLQFGQDWNISVAVLDMTVQAPETSLLEALLEKPKLLWIETPANPTWDITDLVRVSSLARTHGAMVVVDSTGATPVHTQPLKLGADIVMHSATKYLNGHSDVLAGALVAGKQMASTERWAKIRQIRKNNGMMLGSMDAWLLQRGMRTLFVRVQRQSASALAIATHVHQNYHPSIIVLYPGLPTSPGYVVAQKQMWDGFGGMLSLRIIQAEGGGPPGSLALQFAARLKVFTRATSLGGVESLVEHRKSIEGPSSPIPADLLRFSVGIEDVRDLIADLDQAAQALP